MKTRKGFVSNSSSSSFIIGLGIVDDEDKFIEAAKLVGLSVSGENQWGDIEIKTLAKLKEEGSGYDHTLSETTITIEAFDYTTVSLSINGLPDDTKVAILQCCGELTDDCDFQHSEDDWECDYDLSPTDTDRHRL